MTSVKLNGQEVYGWKRIAIQVSMALVGAVMVLVTAFVLLLSALILLVLSPIIALRERW